MLLHRINIFNFKFTIAIFIQCKSRLVVDEEGLKWVENDKSMSLLVKQFRDFFVQKHIGN